MTRSCQVNLSTPRPKGRGLPWTRAQAEGLEVHPERCPPTSPLKAGLRTVERVKLHAAFLLLFLSAAREKPESSAIFVRCRFNSNKNVHVYFVDESLEIQ